MAAVASMPAYLPDVSEIRRPQTKWGTTAEVVSDVVCDRCGQSCVKERTPASAGTFADTLELERASLSADWGYWSGRDGERWAADLCEDCALLVRELVDSGAGPGVQVVSGC